MRKKSKRKRERGEKRERKKENHLAFLEAIKKHNYGHDAGGDELNRSLKR